MPMLDKVILDTARIGADPSKATMVRTALESTRPIDTSTSAHPRDYVDLLRPAQWFKNVVVFAAPAAGLKLLEPLALWRTTLAFAAFCLMASATYAINDAVDRQADVLHPLKHHRPVARGAISPGHAIALSVLLFVIACILTTTWLPRGVTLIVVAYFAMTLAYSLYLKRRMILDVIIIATGFVLRAWGGAMAVEVVTSPWLVACLFTLCLFMGFGKRRCEIAMIGNLDNAGEHRPTLLRYTPDLLNHLITVSAGIAIVTFLLYTLDVSAHPVPFHKEYLFYTLPIVIYGVFRFAMLSEIGQYTGPTEIVLRDKAMLGAIILWAVAALIVVYEKRLFGLAGLAGVIDGFRLGL